MLQHTAHTLRSALWLMLGLTCVSGAQAAKKGISLDDLKPKKSPSSSTPTPRPTLPRPPQRTTPPATTRKPAPKPKQVIAKQPVVPAQFVVAQSGTAAYRTVGEALAKAPPGAKIQVRSGTYRESLHITKPVEIVSASPDDTVTIEGGNLPAVRIQSRGVSMRRLAFRTAPGAGRAEFAVEIRATDTVLEDCVVNSGAKACVGVQGASSIATLRKCRFSGDQQGLQVTNGATVTLETCVISENPLGGAWAANSTLNARSCQFKGNGKAGLLLQNSASGTLEDSDLTGNHGPGASFSGASSPTFTRVRSFGNEGDGIEVTDGSKGFLIDCELYENGTAGLAIRNGGNPTARGCRIRGNKGEGVVGNGKSQGTLENCDLIGNTANGILLRNESHLTVRGGRIEGLTVDAVHVTERSLADFAGCEISKGKSAAVVAVFAGANATLRKVRVHGGYWGILAQSGSQLNLDDCDVYETDGPAVQLTELKGGSLLNTRIYRSKNYGLVVEKGSAPTIERCDVYSNTLANMHIADRANPSVSRCTFRDGSGAGITVVEGGLGTIEDCEIRKNGRAGVTIITDGNPMLRRCKITGNAGPGINSHQGGHGQAEGTEIRGNNGGSVQMRDGSRVMLRNCVMD